MGELKQRISATTLKLKCYNLRVKQYRQNRTFKKNQKVLYEDLDGKKRQEYVMPDTKESINF